ncbi:MAG: hypothetical protein ACLGH6_01995 [Gammaproteobacteria bacterium]
MKISKRLKSKTYWLAIATAGLGIVEVNMHLLQAALGQYYGAAFIVVALLGMAVREITTGPVADK